MPRRRLKKLGFDLEEMLRHVAQDYRNFVAGNAAHQELEVSKLFRARHDAARAGLAHLEALLRLEAAGMEASEQSALLAAIQRARAALAADAAAATPGQEDSADDAAAGE